MSKWKVSRIESIVKNGSRDLDTREIDPGYTRTQISLINEDDLPIISALDISICTNGDNHIKIIWTSTFSENLVNEALISSGLNTLSEKAIKDKEKYFIFSKKESAKLIKFLRAIDYCCPFNSDIVKRIKTILSLEKEFNDLEFQKVQPFALKKLSLHYLFKEYKIFDQTAAKNCINAIFVNTPGQAESDSCKKLKYRSTENTLTS